MPTLWPFIPSQVRETLEFATDVRGTPVGEFRYSLKEATQRFSLSYIQQPDERTRLELLYRADPDAEWYLPVWSDATWHAGSISAGAGSLSVATDADYRAGGFAAIVSTDQAAEVVSVASVGSGSITLGSGEPVASYAGPVLIAPVGRFLMPEGLTRTTQYSLEVMQAEFVRLDASDLGASSFTTHRTYSVLTDASVVVQPLAGAQRQLFDLIDNGFGAYALESEETYVRARGVIAFADSGATARWARKRWFHFLRGRDRPFWVSSWKNDLPLAASVAAAATTASVQDIPVAASELVGRSVQFNLGGGTLIHREITAAVDAGSTTTITISAPGQDIPTSAKVSLLHLMRLDTDAVEIEHQYIGDDFLSRVSVPVVEVPA